MKKRKSKKNKIINKLRNKKFSSRKRFTKTKTPSKFKTHNYYIKVFISFFLIIIYFLFSYHHPKNNYGLPFNKKMKDYHNKEFIILQRKDCPGCGFFSFYGVHLGCINKTLNEGSIPIIDLQSFSNKYNKGNLSLNNPWELFFYQINNYTLQEVKKFAKKIKYEKCIPNLDRPDERYLYYQNDSIIFWRNLAKKNMPVKKELINEAENIMKKLFGNSRNILGVKLRGTDYVKGRPHEHAIPPKVKQVINDVKDMDRQYNYDFIFLVTEDEDYKKQFLPQFGEKLKLFNPVILKEEIKKIEDLNEQIKAYFDFIKNYVLNIIILSKCLDLIAARCGGTMGTFIITEGFRYTKIYNLGEY